MLPRRSDTPEFPGLRPEAELLLCAAGVQRAEVQAARIRKLAAGGLDWDEAIRLAAHNRIPTLLYRAIVAAGLDSGAGSAPHPGAAKIPAHILDRLRESFQRTSVRNMFLARELVELVKAFERAGIQALPYKGPLLAEALYGHLGLRQFWDLDILVRKEDVLKAKTLLVARGYRPERSFTPEEEISHLEFDCEYNFDRGDGLAHVEIHWRVLPEPFSRRIDSDYVWERAVPAGLMETAALTLPPEELFLILCFHAGDKHQWARLQWISDIARFVAVYRDLDWDGILDEAERAGGLRTVALGLHLARVLLDAEMPPAAARRLRREPGTSALAGLVRGRLFRKGFGLPGFSEWLRYIEAEDGPAAKGAAADRARQFLRYLKAVMRPEFCDRYTLALPPWLSFFTYFYRTWRLARTHKGGLISRLR